MKRCMLGLAALGLLGGLPGCYLIEGGRPTPPAPAITLPDGVGFTVLSQAPGDAREAHPGDVVRVEYAGYLADGTPFDASTDHGEPLEFTLGAGQVIPGWDEGVLNMRVGERRRLVIPPAQAYGEAGSPPVIPPRATLVFEVKLVEVR